MNRKETQTHTLKADFHFSPDLFFFLFKGKWEGKERSRSELIHGFVFSYWFIDCLFADTWLVSHFIVSMTIKLFCLIAQIYAFWHYIAARGSWIFGWNHRFQQYYCIWSFFHVSHGTIGGFAEKIQASPMELICMYVTSLCSCESIEDHWYVA